MTGTAVEMAEPITNLDQVVAHFVAETDLADIPASVQEVAKRGLVDTVAAVLAGLDNELAVPLFKYLELASAPGSYPVIGTAMRVAADKAALANGILGHALDFDDTVSAMPGHPSAIILSALLSSPDIASRSGTDLLTAYIIGFEVAAKMGMALGSGHYMRGWHTTGTGGVFGASAGAARLSRLDTATTGMVIGITASMAAGIRANFGTMTKPLHSGWAASSGVTATQLATSGFTSSAVALSGKRGFFAVYGGGDEAAAARVLASLGAPYTFEEPGVSLKRYPCCYALHRAIDAIESLRREGLLTDGWQVRRITATVPPHSLDPLPYSRPTTGLEAKFSMEYVLAAGLVGDDFSFDCFSDEATRRPEILELIERCVAVEDPALSPDDPAGRAKSAGTRGSVDVHVEFNDGRVISRRVTSPPGSPSRPLSWDDVRSKFFSCASVGGLSEASARIALNCLENLEQQSDLYPLIASLTKVSEQ
jgi:2-methylcitrate dehydratase PrpD